MKMKPERKWVMALHDSSFNFKQMKPISAQKCFLWLGSRLLAGINFPINWDHKSSALGTLALVNLIQGFGMAMCSPSHSKHKG